MKEWTTITKHSVYEVQFLNNAEQGDFMNYRIAPPLPSPAADRYSTVDEAIEAINQYGVLMY